MMATPLPQQRLGNSWCILPDASWRGHDITPSGAGRRFCYLMRVSYAEFSIWPKLLIPGNIEETVQNISAHPQLFAAGILCNLITLIEDVVIAWALYVLLIPVNRALSLLTAWFRLMYTAIALFAVLNLVTVYRLLTTSDSLRSLRPLSSMPRSNFCSVHFATTGRSAC